MSPATWQHSWRLLLTRRICCSELRSRCAGVVSVASTNLNRESWKYPTYGSHADSEAAEFGGTARRPAPGDLEGGPARFELSPHQALVYLGERDARG